MDLWILRFQKIPTSFKSSMALIWGYPSAWTNFWRFFIFQIKFEKIWMRRKNLSSNTFYVMTQRQMFCGFSIVQQIFNLKMESLEMDFFTATTARPTGVSCNVRTMWSVVSPIGRIIEYAHVRNGVTYSVRTCVVLESADFVPVILMAHSLWSFWWFFRKVFHTSFSFWTW